MVGRLEFFDFEGLLELQGSECRVAFRVWEGFCAKVSGL